MRAGGAEGEGAPAQRESTPVQPEEGQRPGGALPDAGGEDGRPRKKAASTDFIASAITRRFGWVAGKRRLLADMCNVSLSG